MPIEAFVRVQRVARFDGMGVLFVAGLFALISASGGDRVGAIVGLLIAGSGAIELHGVMLLQHGDTRGMRWLVGSQLFLMGSILAYCVFRMGNVDLTLLQAALSEEKKAQIVSLGYKVDEFLMLTYRITWWTIGVVTVLYQGGMTIYYLRRRRAVEQALEEAPE
ncbi:hypothetical protein DB354_17945 [Opitutus sp. ER46]|nr:hypothetical protein DB354_17945 [Opitutus sp. ER46]